MGSRRGRPLGAGWSRAAGVGGWMAALHEPAPTLGWATPTNTPSNPCGQHSTLPLGDRRGSPSVEGLDLGLRQPLRALAALCSASRRVLPRVSWRGLGYFRGPSVSPPLRPLSPAECCAQAEGADGLALAQLLSCGAAVLPFAVGEQLLPSVSVWERMSLRWVGRIQEAQNLWEG